jgi:hypothetical protein
VTSVYDKLRGFVFIVFEIVVYFSTGQRITCSRDLSFSFCLLDT